MSRRQSRPLCYLVVFALCSASLLPMALARAKYAGHQDETTMSFRIGDVQPELTGPFMYQTMRTKIGEPDRKGRQRIRLVFDAKNMTNKDWVVHLTATLLDEEGQSIAIRTVIKKIDDEEREKIRLRFRKLTTAQIALVKEIKIRVAYEND